MLAYILLAVTMGLLVLLFLVNLSTKNRHKQIFGVLLSFLFFCVYYTVYLHVLEIINLDQFIPDLFNKFINFVAGWINDKFPDELLLIDELKYALLYIGSLLFVLLYVILKLFLLFYLSVEGALAKNKDISFMVKIFYTVNENQIELRDKWIFLRRLTISLGSLLFLVSIMYVYHKSIGIAWPIFLPIASLLLLEVGFFLGGIESNLKRFNIFIEDISSRTKNDLNALFEAFKETFGEKLLASTKKDISVLPTNSSYRVKNEYLKAIFSELEEGGTKLCGKYLEGLDMLISSHVQNVLFSSAYDEKYALYLRVLFDYAYLHNQRILFVVLDDSEKETTLNWLTSLTEEESYLVSDCEGFEYNKRSNHILIDTIKQMLSDDRLDRHYKEFQYFVVLDLKNFMRKNHLYLNTLLNIYKSKTNQFPKILGFSNISSELEVGFNIIFMGDSESTREIKITHESAKKLYLLAFKTEGEKRFEEYLNLGRGQYIGSEIPLAYFAWSRGGVSPIVISSSSSSLEEELEALENICKECSFVKDHMQIVPNRFFNNISEDNQVFIVEDIQNLQQNISKWQNYTSTEELFMVIVSSNYLFRDYYASNIELILENYDWYSEIFPKGVRSKKEEAFLLLARLASSSVHRDDIILEDNLLVTRKNIADFINKHGEFQIEPSLLSVRETREFKDTSAHELFSFEKNIYYEIPSKSYYPELYYYTFLNTNRRAIGICLEDDIYHKYITGMNIILKGNIYEIKSINSFSREVHIEFKNTNQIFPYEIRKSISMKNSGKDSRLLSNKKIGTTAIKLSLSKVDYSCRIDEFIEHSNKHTVIVQSVDPIVYNNKETLLLHYTTPTIVSDSLRLAFEFMFSEVLQTLFPKTYHLLSVRVLTKESNQCFIFDDKDNGFEDNELKLYIFETGRLNYHLLDTIAQDIYYERILMLIQDFIVWSNENDKPIQKESTIYDIESMDFVALNEFISILLSNSNRITNNRLGEFTGTNTIVGNVHYCDFCGETLPLQFETLKDGREQCHKCKNSSVEYLGKSYKDLVNEAIEYLEKTYGITISQALTVKIVSADTLNTELGESFQPTSGYDHRAVGLAVSGDAKTVWIENSAPVFRAIAVIVHELTHVWQFDNLDFDKMGHDKVKIEGHAQWVELTFIKERYPMYDQYIQKEKERNDEYGKGYHYVERVLENRAEGSMSESIFSSDSKGNPFDAYRDMFGQSK